MNKSISLETIFSELDQGINCYDFLKKISASLPFKGVSFVEVPEVLPAKIKSKYVFSAGREVEEVQFFLCDTVRRKLKNTIWTPENFLIDPSNLDNQEVITKFGIKVLSRIPIYYDCNSIAGILYFAHDEEILSEKSELFSALNAIGSIFSRLYFREFGCDLRGSVAEVDLLKKMMDSNHDLISSVIHDLSNPLTVIYFETQKSLSNKEKDLNKSLRNIETSIDHIYKIIDSTKKFFSKYKEKEDLQTLSIENVVDFISFQYGTQLLEKGLNFESEGLNFEFIAFRSTFLNTVIGSLISNSIRYSAEKATIKLYGREVNKRIEVVIEDKAGGFPEEVLDNLKSNFKSRPTPSTDGDIGSGMGLVLAKSYLQIMNGSLEIESLGKGSRIILRMSK
ncbi:HAMP domain-containing sensor histidine kinase [Halobacteriovorax sp. JY17]|uniref:sensor histidine kinase n=1 Tax=Halobacteriovorax sp. JY17 TaxID=2014617 RepID=UPI000C3B158B|nr:HAMP domain-containing sensor histidine kinase [Halobacteriovorax sp. JY17]PIK16182.1 MAG: hypothetical protein CES88_05460 [Halobacteriovorax sp. JY17]